MTPCDDITPHLFAYQLGACERAVRDDIDAHLLGCTSCLRAYLGHKRVSEDGAAFDERPSGSMRSRLHSVVRAKRAHRKAPVAVWVMAIAAVALALVGTLWALRPAPQLTNVTGLVDSPNTYAAAHFF